MIGKIALYTGDVNHHAGTRVCLVIGRDIKGSRMPVGTVYSGWLVLLGTLVVRIRTCDLKEIK
jgi:hypothetical protein